MRWGLRGVAGGLAAAFVVGLVVAVALYLANAPVTLQILLGVTAPWLVLAGWPLLTTTLLRNGPRLDLFLRLRFDESSFAY